MSSVRTDSGSSTEAYLTLGRKLAEHVEPYDLPGNWMAHHLAEIVIAAEDEENTTVEQRIQIVDTIRKLWVSRHSFPGKSFPGYEFENIFAALDRLGDDRLWRFARLPLEIDVPTDPEFTELPLVVAAADLERMVRETVITLLLAALEEAVQSAAEWVEASNELKSTLEGELGPTANRIRRRLREVECRQGDSSAEADANPLSAYNHARRLRAMADQLNRIASTIDPET